MEKVKKGTILVNMKKQVYSCGATLLSANAIVKAASDSNGDYLRIYRDKQSEQENDDYRIRIQNVRLATTKEQEAWEKGERYA